MFGRLVICGALIAFASLVSTLPSNFSPAGDNDRNYWLHRKKEFYRSTKFNFTDDNLRLLGYKRTRSDDLSSVPVGHLPFWFDYELFKRVFNKPTSSDPTEELKRHHAYITTCMRVIKLRVLFRMLAGTEDSYITSEADKFYWEKLGNFSPDFGKEEDGISIYSNMKFESDVDTEQPLDKAIRLMKQEMERVESRNQVWHYLKAFNEVDGSAIAGKLPY